MNDENRQENEVPEAEAETIEAQPMEPVASPEIAEETAPEPERVEAELVSPMPTNDPLAIVSLVCGIASCVFGVCCGFVGLPVVAAGIITGILAMNRIKSAPDTYTGHGLAMVGVITSGVGAVLVVLRVVLGIGLFVVGQAAQ